jgi:hypothetical protein
MRFSFALTLALSVTSLTAAAGCTTATDDASTPEVGSADLTGSTPITLGNFLNHPKIKEVRAEVGAVDAAKLTTVERDASCPDEDGTSTRAKSTDGGGKVRKLVLAWGGSDGDATSTYYYDAAGRLRFELDVNETAPASGALIVDELRVYYDATGARLFDVSKSARGTVAHPPNMDRAPLKRPDPDTTTDTDPQIVTNPGGYYDSKVVCTN